MCQFCAIEIDVDPKKPWDRIREHLKSARHRKTLRSSCHCFETQVHQRYEAKVCIMIYYVIPHSC